MAIASVGTLGTSVSSTSAATFAVVTATNALAAGDFALFEITTAPQTGAADGVNNEHKSFSGGTGIWTKVGEFTNASGCTVSLWLFEATGTVATGTTLTLTLAGAVVDKTASGWKFTKGAGTSIALDTAPTTNPITNLTDASSGFGSAAFSGLANVARLYFRALGKKANTTTALTVSTGFTAITAARSRNNTSAVTSYGEFRINTSTGETSNPTLAVSGDTSGVFASLREVTPSDPTTLTDNFDDNSKDATKWGTDAPLCRGGAESGTVSEVNARTEVTPVASTVAYGGRLSNSYFDMTGKRIYAKVSNITSLPSGQEVYIAFGWRDQKNYNAVVQLGTNVFAFQGTADSTVNNNGVFSDGMWLGLRHNASDDTIHVETAPAAENPPVTWTDQASQARDQRAPLKAVLLGFGTGCFNLTVGSPSTVQFDGFNTATTSGASLTATNLTTASPALGSPTLAQIHVLVATALATASPLIGAPALAQTHGLGASSLTTASSGLGTPALSVVVSLTASNLATGSPSLAAPGLGQAHVLAAGALAMAIPSLGSPAIVQTHGLAASAIATASPALGQPAVGQIHGLSASSLAVASPGLGTPTLAITVSLTASNLTTGAPDVGSPTVGQVHLLAAGAFATSAPVLGAPSLGQVHLLATGSLVPASPVVGSPILAQVHALAPVAISTSSPALGNPVFAQLHVLTASSIATSTPEIGTPHIAVGGELLAADLITASPQIGAPPLGQAHQLVATGLATSVPDIAAPDLHVTRNLITASLAISSPEVGAPALGQAHGLASAGLTTGAPALGSPTLSVPAGLAADPLATAAPDLGHPNLNLIRNLLADPVATASPVIDVARMHIYFIEYAPPERTVRADAPDRLASGPDRAARLVMGAKASRVVTGPHPSRTV